MRRLLAIAALFIVLGANPGRAESPIETLKSFGFTGTWSDDCTKATSKEAGYRISFMQSDSGKVTFDSVSRFDADVAIVRDGEIRSAIKIGDDRLEIAGIVTKNQTVRRNQSPENTKGYDFEITYQKLEQHIKMTDARTPEGEIGVENGKGMFRFPDGSMRLQEMPLMERCPD